MDAVGVHVASWFACVLGAVLDKGVVQRLKSPLCRYITLLRDSE